SGSGANVLAYQESVLENKATELLMRHKSIRDRPRKFFAYF
ncbi:MAG: hypothetical protein ACI9SB_000712, partial [Candidatus Azotimanducaceae bacterium]